MNRSKQLETILTLCVALAIFFLIFQIKTLLILLIGLGLIGMFSHYLSDKIAWAWLKLAEGLGFVTSKILLTAVFIVFLCPMALVSNLFGRNKMQLKKTTGNSYYVVRNHEFSRRDLKNMW